MVRRGDALIQAAARAILIVEDDAVLADMLAAVLKDAGYAADVSATPEAARGTYDLVVADYLAPSYAPGRPWPHLDALRSLAPQFNSVAIRYRTIRSLAATLR